MQLVHFVDFCVLNSIPVIYDGIDENDKRWHNVTVFYHQSFHKLVLRYVDEYMTPMKNEQYFSELL